MAAAALLKILNCGGYISVVGAALAGPGGGVACRTARLAVAGPARLRPARRPAFEPHRWSSDAALAASMEHRCGSGRDGAAAGNGHTGQDRRRPPARRLSA